MVSSQPVRIVILSQKTPRAAALQSMILDGMEGKVAVEVRNMSEDVVSENSMAADVCILDLMSSGSKAGSTLSRVIENFPAAGIIAMHIYTAPELVLPLFEQGAKGYLTYNPSRKELIHCIRTVAAGEKCLPEFFTV
jgi:DNA-binding NarL/FixJ family response regulator